MVAASAIRLGQRPSTTRFTSTMQANSRAPVPARDFATTPVVHTAPARTAAATAMRIARCTRPRVTCSHAATATGIVSTRKLANWLLEMKHPMPSPMTPPSN
jgi:hypothetical protein